MVHHAIVSNNTITAREKSDVTVGFQHHLKKYKGIVINNTLVPVRDIHFQTCDGKIGENLLY